jgi:hypothetical protein
MASSYTSNSGIEKPAEGDQTGEWGDTVNTNMDIIDRSINGVGAITLSGTTHTLTTTDGTLSDGMYKVLVLGGSPSGTNTITIAPNTADKIYIVVNSSGQTATFTQGSGANVSVLNGDSKIIYADGAGSGAAIVDVTADLSFSSVNIDGGTIDGTVIGGASAAAGTFTTLDTSSTVNLNLTTDSSSSTSGALIIDGGVGIAKKLYVGTDADIDGTLEADAMTLNGTAITTTATLSTGISNTNVPVFTSGVADDDFLRVAGTSIEGRSAAEVLSDIGASAAAGSSSIVTTGALDAGSITSGFGTINNGSSAITTTGLISGGSLDIDDVVINGSTIGHTDDTDLITVANGVATVAGEVSMTTLDIGGTNVTSTAAELNLLDTATAGTTVNSKAVIYGSGGNIAATDIAVSGSGNRAITITSSDGIASMEIGSASSNQAFIDLKTPSSDDFDVRLTSNSDGAGGSINIAGGTFAINGSAEVMATFTDDGAVSLYHNNAVKLATASGGVAITGDATFADSGKAIFGAGSDLQIFHDGSDSYVKDAGTGRLVVETDGTDVSLKAGSDNMLVAAKDGAVTLYYDNASKIATHASGALMTTTSELQFYTTAYGIRASTGLEIKTGDFTRFLNGTTEYMRILADGKVGIGTSAPDSLVEISSGAATTAKIATTVSNNYAELIFEDGNAGYAWQVRSDGAQSIPTGSFVLNDRDTGSFPIAIVEGNGTNTIIVKNSRLGIHTDPSYSLHVKGSVGIQGADDANEGGQIDFVGGTSYTGYGKQIDLYQQDFRFFGPNSWNASFFSTTGGATASITASGSVTGNSLVVADGSNIGSTSNTNTFTITANSHDDPHLAIDGTTHVNSPTNTGTGVWALQANNLKTDNSTASNVMRVRLANISPGDGNHMFQCVDGGGTVRFFVQNNGTRGGTSDVTLKENIVDATAKLAELRQLKVRNYNWIDHGPEGGFKELGFIAQEVETIFPKMVRANPETGKKMLLDDVFVPILVKSLQEAADKIDALETRIAALEAE